MKKFILVLIFLLFSVQISMAAGLCVAERVRDAFGRETVTWTWTSDAAGDVTGLDGVMCVTGTVASVWFIPDGTDTPTDLYDVVINTEDDDFDVLFTGGANRSNTATTASNVFTPLDSTNSKLVTLPNNTCIHPVISNAGNAKKGVIKMTLF